MPILLVILLVGVPLLELVVIIQVGQAIGAGWTVLLVVALSLLGAWLLSREGRRAWAQFRAAVAEGRWPGDEVTQGALVIFGGALLLTPGFVTDGVGLLCLLPPTRAALSSVIRSGVSAGFLGGRAGRATWAARRVGGAAQRRRKDATARTGDDLGIEVVEIRRQDGTDDPEALQPPSGDDAPDGDPDEGPGPSRD